MTLSSLPSYTHRPPLATKTVCKWIWPEKYFPTNVFVWEIFSNPPHHENSRGLGAHHEQPVHPPPHRALQRVRAWSRSLMVLLGYRSRAYYPVATPGTPQHTFSALPLFSRPLPSHLPGISRAAERARWRPPPDTSISRSLGTRTALPPTPPDPPREMTPNPPGKWSAPEQKGENMKKRQKYFPTNSGGGVQGNHLSENQLPRPDGPARCGMWYDGRGELHGTRPPLGDLVAARKRIPAFFPQGLFTPGLPCEPIAG